MTRERHICATCQRFLLAFDFSHNGRTGGGWVDSEGIRRRSECRTCKRRRDNSRNRGVPFEPVPFVETMSPTVPLEPFVQWLEHKRSQWNAQGRSTKEFAASIGLSVRQIERYIQRDQPTVHWNVVDRILTKDGTTDLWELYPSLYPREVA